MHKSSKIGKGRGKSEIPPPPPTSGTIGTCSQDLGNQNILSRQRCFSLSVYSVHLRLCSYILASYWSEILEYWPHAFGYGLHVLYVRMN